MLVSPYWPPGPEQEDEWSAILTEDPTLEPALCKLAYGISSGLDPSPLEYGDEQIRALGNAVVPITAALAFLTLRDRLAENLARACNGS